MRRRLRSSAVASTATIPPRTPSSRAAPLTGAADVLAVFGIEPEPAAEEDSPLLEVLPASADELVRRTGLGADEIARMLVELELEGRVVVRDGVYRRAS